MSIASLILGILGMILSCLAVGVIPSAIGLVLGICALKKQRPNKGSAIAGIVTSSIGIAIFLIIMIVAVNSGRVEEGHSSAYNESEATSKEPTTTQVEKEEIATSESTSKEAEEAKETGAESNPETNTEKTDGITIGSSFEAKNFKITINSADFDFKDFDNSYGLYDLEDGMKYVSVSFTFENIGNSDSYVSIYDFKCYADNTACEQKYLPDGSDFINANLSSGRNITFKTYYAVPKDAKSIELEYETNMFTGKKEIIKLQ